MGHSHQEKFAQWRIKFAKIISKFCQILNEPIEKGQSFLTVVLKRRDFAKSGHTEILTHSLTSSFQNTKPPIHHFNRKNDNGIIEKQVMDLTQRIGCGFVLTRFFVKGELSTMRRTDKHIASKGRY